MPGWSVRRENGPLHTEAGALREREATAPPPIPSPPGVLKLLQQSPVFLLAEEQRFQHSGLSHVLQLRRGLAF